MSSTLQDVARLAEVSVSTASRALNRHPAISAETVSRVRRVAEQVNYVPRRSHRRPDAGQLLSRTHIGLICLGMDRALTALPTVASAISGAEAALSKAGALAVLSQVPDIQNASRLLLEKGLDGVILVGALQGTLISQTKSDLLDWLRTLPSVWLLGRPLGCWGDCVASDDHGTGRMAAEYLVAKGHRRLAFVNPKPDHLLFMRREDGFVATARRLGVEIQAFSRSCTGQWRLPLHPPQNVEAVQELVDELIASDPRPTAVFAVADSVATLVYRALTVRGLRVGEDISVISGNNDKALIEGLYPNLTTFDIHAHDLGQLAVRQLAMRINSPEELPDAELTREPTLVEARSVASIEKSQAGARDNTRPLPG